MNLAQLFNPVEKIVGLEITQGSLKAVLLEKNKKGELVVLKKSVALEESAFRDGALVNKEAVLKTLKSFRQNNKDVFKSSYVLLALPPSFVFTDIMKFPPIAKEQLAESVKLNLNAKTLFPFEEHETYSDWQPVTSHDPYHQEIMLSLALKERVQDYLDICDGAGLAPLAFEPPSLSTARALQGLKETTTLIVRVMHEGIEFSIIAKNEPRFSHFTRMPAVENFDAFKLFIKDQSLHVIHFYAIEHKNEPPVTDIILITSLTKKNEIVDYLARELGVSAKNTGIPPALDISDGYVAAYGAALRGLIPRQNDSLISLMPVGTEETYRRRRMLSYVRLWSDIINATAILLVILFGTTWFFLNTIHKKAGGQLTSAALSGGISTKITELENSARTFNALVASVAATEEKIYPWSSFMKNLLKDLAYEGITIRSITIISPQADITISVTAKTRETAIAFKKSLEKNSRYTAVKTPFFNITQRENISYSFTLAVVPEL